MKTLKLKVRKGDKVREFEGAEALEALTYLLKKGVSLGCHFTDTELPEEERITWRPIRWKGEEIGSVSWSYTDEESGEIVRALELGASIQRKAKERRRENVKVIVRH